MYAYWTSKDEDCGDLEAEITSCVMHNDAINILFRGVDESDPFEGKITIKAENGNQSTSGVWIYPDTKKEAARFTEVQKESEETVYKATVTGILKNYRGKQVNFVGTWDDKAWDAINGCVYDFEIEATIA